jgi:hypothetical protein
MMIIERPEDEAFLDKLGQILDWPAGSQSVDVTLLLRQLRKVLGAALRVSAPATVTISQGVTGPTGAPEPQEAVPTVSIEKAE